MANIKMGFEGQLLYGAAGATATNVLTNSRDITITYSAEEGDTTVRGDSTGPPINTASVTALVCEIEFGMLNDITDTQLAALRAAQANGTPVALRGRDYAAGKGPDGDFILLQGDNPQPLKGEQTIAFRAKPNKDVRTPQLYV